MFPPSFVQCLFCFKGKNICPHLISLLRAPLSPATALRSQTRGHRLVTSAFPCRYLCWRRDLGWLPDRRSSHFVPRLPLLFELMTAASHAPLLVLPCKYFAFPDEMASGEQRFWFEGTSLLAGGWATTLPGWQYPGQTRTIVLRCGARSSSHAELLFQKHFWA